MGKQAGKELRAEIKRTVDNSSPAIKLDSLIDAIDADRDDVITAVIDLQRNGELKHDIIMWRGGGDHSLSP